MPALFPRRGSSPAAIARSTLTVLAGSAVGLTGALAIRILLARTLTPADVGVVVLGMGITSAAGGVATLGLGQAVGRRVAELRASGREHLARASGAGALAMGAGSGLLTALITVAAAPFIEGVFGSPHLGIVILLLAPLVLALPVGAASVGVGRAWGDAAGRALLREAAGGALRVGGVAVGALVFHDLRAAAAGFALGGLLGELGYATFVWGRGWFTGGGSSHWDDDLLRRLPPFWLMVIITQLETWLSVFVLGLFAPPAVVGLYGMARGLTRAVKLVEYAAGHSFLPSATTLLGQGNRSAFLRLYVRARTLIFALQWPALAVCIFTPEMVMTIVFGPAYGAAAVTLRFLAGATAVTSVVSAGKDQTLIAAGRAGNAVAIESVSVGVTMVALLSLIPTYGSDGAALSVFIGALVQATAQTWLVVARTRVVPLTRDLHPLPVVALAGCGITKLLGVSAGLAPLTELIAVATCACIGSATCVIALWRDHVAPGWIFPAGPSGDRGGFDTGSFPGTPGEGDVPTTLLEP
jgi:O-antigen/teichoic acid export membrane protein